MTVSAEPFQFGTRYGDDEPTIHIGWTSDRTQKLGVATWAVNRRCVIDEAFIQFQNPSIARWEFGEPNAAGGA